MPYKSDAQRRFMHAKHPEIAAKWDAEIRRKKKVAKAEKPLMSDAEIKRRKKLQGEISRTTSTLGLTGVGLLGTSLALKKNPKLFKAVPGLKKANPDKLRETAQNIGLASGGIGGVGGYNFAAYTNAESRKRKATVVKAFDGPEMESTFGVEGIAKNWEPMARQYNPEANRRRRNEAYPVAATAVAGGTGAAAIDQGLVGRAKKLEGKQVAGLKRISRAKKLGAASAAAGGAAVLLHRRKDSDSWASYSKSATSAFGVSHD